MWMPAVDLAGVKGGAVNQVSDAASNCENVTLARRGQTIPRWQRWMPSLTSMPPLVQFVLHAAQWCRAKCVPGAKQGAQLRLVGQLTLGAKRHLSLVEVGGVQFLVGGGTEHVTVIVPISTPTVPLTGDTGEVREELQP